MSKFLLIFIQKYRVFYLILTLVMCIIVSGCSSREHVRHLVSDAILIVPHQSTQKEVVSLLGEPDQRQELSDGVEEWIYYHTTQSFLRKTPYVGDRVGSENSDVIMINFKDDLVISRTYRLLTEKEFVDSGIKSNNQPDDK